MNTHVTAGDNLAKAFPVDELRLKFPALQKYKDFIFCLLYTSPSPRD